MSLAGIQAEAELTPEQRRYLRHLDGIGKRSRHPNGAQVERVMACLNCGARMEERGCKRSCPRCHFFEDCSNL